MKSVCNLQSYIILIIKHAIIIHVWLYLFQKVLKIAIIVLFLMGGHLENIRMQQKNTHLSSVSTILALYWKMNSFENKKLKAKRHCILLTLVPIIWRMTQLHPVKQRLFSHYDFGNWHRYDVFIFQ